MSVLVGDELEGRLRADGVKRLYVIPMLEPAQLRPSGIDLRLGNQFIVARNAVMSALDLSAKSPEVRKQILQYQERMVFPFLSGKPFVLHPGQLVLGSSFEYIALPLDLEARIDGRSSLARLGLTVAGALSIAPGFKGVITLELANHGNTPLVLHPGLIIAQLVVSGTQGEAPYSARYLYPIGPQFSKLAEDKHLSIWAGEVHSPSGG